MWGARLKKLVFKSNMTDFTRFVITSMTLTHQGSKYNSFVGKSYRFELRKNIEFSIHLKRNSFLTEVLKLNYFVKLFKLIYRKILRNVIIESWKNIHLNYWTKKSNKNIVSIIIHTSRPFLSQYKKDIIDIFGRVKFPSVF